MTLAEEQGNHLAWSTFVVDVSPHAMWGTELREQNRTFLNGLDPTFFTNTVDAHLPLLDHADRRRAQHAALAIRIVYGQAVETLYALLAAAVQAPNCPLGWILSYRGPQLYSFVRKLNGQAGQAALLTREETPTGWYDLSRQIHRFTHPNPAEDERIKTLFAETWALLAREFLDPLSAEEYNSIKHGFRARAGGSSLTLTPVGSQHPALDSQSEYGARFFHVVDLGDKINFYAQDAMRNWAPTALAIRTELVAVSIQNIVTYLRMYLGLGVNDGTTVEYRWPEATAALALAWKVDFSVESMSGGQVLMRDDIEPLSKDDVLRACEHDGADRTDRAD